MFDLINGRSVNIWSLNQFSANDLLHCLVCTKKGGGKFLENMKYVSDGRESENSGSFTQHRC